jgi:hypothetical protein
VHGSLRKPCHGTGWMLRKIGVQTLSIYIGRRPHSPASIRSDTFNGGHVFEVLRVCTRWRGSMTAGPAARKRRNGNAEGTQRHPLPLKVSLRSVEARFFSCGKPPLHSP